MPLIPRWERDPVLALPRVDHDCVDVAWVQIESRADESQVRDGLTERMSALPGFVKCFWVRGVEYEETPPVLMGHQKIPTQSFAAAVARAQSSPAMFADRRFLITVWKDRRAREAAERDYGRILDDAVATSYVHPSAPMKHQVLLMCECSGRYTWLGRREVSHLEVISFRVSAGVVERELFEHAWGTYLRLVVLLSSPFIPSIRPRPKLVGVYHAGDMTGPRD